MKYKARQIPKQPDIHREFQRVQQALDTVEDGEVLEVLPEKPREAMRRYFAAGVVTGGSNKGYYYYDGSAWVFMG